MITIFILVGGTIIACVLRESFVHSYCSTVSMREFGTLAGVGALELIFELKTLISVWQKKSKAEEDEKENK